MHVNMTTMAEQTTWVQVRWFRWQTWTFTTTRLKWFHTCNTYFNLSHTWKEFPEHSNYLRYCHQWIQNEYFTIKTNINAVRNYVPVLNDEGECRRRLKAPQILNWTLNGGEPASRTDHSTPWEHPPPPATTDSVAGWTPEPVSTFQGKENLIIISRRSNFSSVVQTAALSPQWAIPVREPIIT